MNPSQEIRSELLRSLPLDVVNVIMKDREAATNELLWEARFKLKKVCSNWRIKLVGGYVHKCIGLVCGTCNRCYCDYCKDIEPDDIGIWEQKEDGLFYTDECSACGQYYFSYVQPKIRGYYEHLCLCGVMICVNKCRTCRCNYCSYDWDRPYYSEI